MKSQAGARSLALAGSLLLHLLLLAFLWNAPLSPSVPVLPELQLRMVRLVGGGDNLPGFIRPPLKRELAPPPEMRETRPVEAEESPDLPSPLRDALPLRKRQADSVPPLARTPQAREPRPVEELVEEPAPAAPAPSSEVQESEGEATLPVDESPRPGPFGPGHDVVSDAGSATGIGNWLSRVKGSVLRNYRYPARGSGRFCVYRFQVESDGRMSEPELTQASGDPILDHAALVALKASRLPPLPPASGLQQLAVSFKFSD